MNFGPTHRYFSIGISTTCSQCIFIRTQDSGRVSGTVRNVYDVVQGQDLPEEKIRDTSSQLVGGAWVRFTSPLPRADDRDAVESDPWIRRHSADAQSQSAMAGGRCKGGRDPRGDVPLRRNEGSGRGSSALQGNGSQMADCIHIKCSNDWEEMATSSDSARITTSKGSIGYILGSSCRLPPQAASDLVHRITARLRYTMARAASRTNMSWSSTSRQADGNIAPPRMGREVTRS